eukprot:5650585-Lingulodinium_polyedra.AAC.1
MQVEQPLRMDEAGGRPVATTCGRFGGCTSGGRWADGVDHWHQDKHDIDQGHAISMGASHARGGREGPSCIPARA